MGVYERRLQLRIRYDPKDIHMYMYTTEGGDKEGLNALVSHLIINTLDLSTEE